ncbi:putative SWI/SNF-related regulator of chromatin [Cercospora beticola]|uniref:Putative SWI/SNF-related regulator of chromatin n=1 Tax=Cercospora beticola TaxID=122368 RepID=A0A2G5HBB1_CERBT|nr:putative SWI/SNF-related regulator of chromatin [Cercospora beticola]PIA89573.1 putative SWI/SNF-related regulator of chromatin [Cercospora beticola]
MYLTWSSCASRAGGKMQAEAQLCIVLYTSEADIDEVGRALDECSIYLQHPQYCDRNVPHRNPHRLCQPGDPIRMTFSLHDQLLGNTLESYQNPADILADLETQEELSEALSPSGLKTVLLGHQKQALTFMHRRERCSCRQAQDSEIWSVLSGSNGCARYVNNITGEESICRPHDSFGGIIADVMGLGKTLTAIALVASDKDALNASFVGSDVTTTLVVVRAPLLQTWATQLPHDIRVQKSATFQAVAALESHARWAISGTPIQNRLLDLSSLFEFLRLPLSVEHGTFQELTNHLISRYGQQGAIQKLRQLIQCVMLRRSLAKVTLPERQDMVCRLEFGPKEARLYQALKTSTLERDSEDGDRWSASCTTFQMFTQLRMVCNLGILHELRAPKQDSMDYETWTPKRSREVFSDLVAAGKAFCSVCRSDLGMATTDAADNVSLDSGRPLIFPCQWLICSTCQSNSKCCTCCNQQSHLGTEVSVLLEAAANKKLALNKDNMPTKIQALLNDLAVHSRDEKSIVLSFWTSTLDVIEQALDNKNIRCVRFDGTVPLAKRNKNISTFSKDPSIRVMLLTISCGAVGLDLTAASRAYLMEPQWNPSVEQQALARVHRMGQTRPVTTIRYIMKDTLEEHVLKVQHDKQMLSQLLLSETNEKSSIGHEELLKSML